MSISARDDPRKPEDQMNLVHFLAQNWLLWPVLLLASMFR